MDSIYIFFGILSLFILFVFGNLLLILMVKSQTKRAFKEIDDYLRRKIELAAWIISEISKLVKSVKKPLKSRPFGVIYDLFKKGGKTVKDEIKKVKKRIIKNKKK